MTTEPNNLCELNTSWRIGRFWRKKYKIALPPKLGVVQRKMSFIRGGECEVYVSDVLAHLFSTKEYKWTRLICDTDSDFELFVVFDDAALATQFKLAYL